MSDSSAGNNEQNKSNLANTSSVYPTVLFGVGKKDLKAKILKAFNESGMTALIVDTADEIMNAIERPEVFAVFIDIEHDRNITMMFSSLVPESRLKWILLSASLNLSKSSAYRNMGFADVLFHPVHPVLMQSRARLMLSRYVKDHDFPAHVILPPGLSVKEIRSKSSALNDDGNDGSRVINVKGDTPATDASRARESGYEAAEDGVTHISGDDTSPDWNHKNTRDPRAKNSRTSITSNAPSDVDGDGGDFLISQSAEGQASAARTAISNTKDLASHANHRSDSSAAPVSFNASLIPDAALNNRKSLGKYETAELRNIIKRLHDHVQILEVVAKNSSEFKTLRIPNESDPNSVYAKGFERCRSEVRNLLIDCKTQLLASNILLLSFTPNAADERYSLISASDPVPGKTLLVPEWLLPEIALSLEKQSPILIDRAHYSNETWQQIIGADWQQSLGGDKPLALAVLPLYRRQSVVTPVPLVCLLILFSESLGMPDRAVIEEMMGVLSIPYHHYSHVDFLNRVYKGLT